MQPATDSARISAMQIKLIHIAKGKLNLTDEAYRALLGERYWAQSCKDLTYAEASDLIDHLKIMGFKIKSRGGHGRGRGRSLCLPAVANNITYLPSKEQLDYIRMLRADIRWRIRDGYYHWLTKWLKKDSIATSREASKVIEGLKGLLKRQEEARMKDEL